MAAVAVAAHAQPGWQWHAPSRRPRGRQPTELRGGYPLTSPPRNTDVAGADTRTWSICGAERSQPGATGRESGNRQNGLDRRKPLPCVATGCRSERMVRRGSAVRVRQRALQKPRKSRLFLSARLARASVCGGYGAVYGAFSSETASGERQNWPRSARIVLRRPSAGAATTALVRRSGSYVFVRQ
jgi:hypothetical protein